MGSDTSALTQLTQGLAASNLNEANHPMMPQYGPPMQTPGHINNQIALQRRPQMMQMLQQIMEEQQKRPT